MKDHYDLDKMQRRIGPVRVDSDAVKTAISIRVDSNDISLLKDEAERLGIPYQTLIGSILHRFVSGELVDKSEAKKIARK